MFLFTGQLALFATGFLPFSTMLNIQLHRHSSIFDLKNKLIGLIESEERTDRIVSTGLNLQAENFVHQRFQGGKTTIEQGSKAFITLSITNETFGMAEKEHLRGKERERDERLVNLQYYLKIVVDRMTNENSMFNDI